MNLKIQIKIIQIIDRPLKIGYQKHYFISIHRIPREWFVIFTLWQVASRHPNQFETKTSKYFLLFIFHRQLSSLLLSNPRIIV